ncbi:hypothetical protein PVAP13_9KG107204 [Panicum virgatum]|uniref:Aminotransferase-like plant mobile domain-containing protein n=1 Tax=Panicum virgatum TaxID=38727 RepID=A0A8T0NP81_PANVG|nr:hypothetical protein PVAP13_9KG107204 [Panicum virgatum]
MTLTLQDVAMLLGLPISGDAVGPRVVPPTWLDDLEERFANIDIAIDVEEHPKATGPAKAWILQFQPDNLAHDADEDSVTRSLEVYLLWLFGYIMFNNSHGAYVDRVLVPYALRSQRQLWRKCLNTVGVQRYLQPCTVASARHRCKISTMQFLQDVRFCYSFGRTRGYRLVARLSTTHRMSWICTVIPRTIGPPWGLSGTLVRRGGPTYSLVGPILNLWLSLIG